MTITITTHGEQTVCTLQGRLDTLAAQEAAKDMQPLLEHADKEILLDCTELEYISSSGLRIFLSVRKEAAKKGGKVIIKGLGEGIRQVFLMTGFYNLFDIQDD